MTYLCLHKFRFHKQPAALHKPACSRFPFHNLKTISQGGTPLPA